MTVEVTPVYGGKWAALQQHNATCPRHGTWVFPPESVELPEFVVGHAECVPVPAELQRRRRHRKSRRSPLLLHVVPAPGPTSNDTAGRTAPGHLGATLGFAPPATRARRHPGTVQL